MASFPANIPILLDGRPVEKITAFLFPKGGNDDPKPLLANSGKSFLGSYVLGMGFTFDDTNPEATPIAEMHRLIEKDPRNADRIFPYIGGEEVNSSPTHAHHRYVINFGELSEDEARKWQDLMAIVEEKVKPDRAKLNMNTADGRRRSERWWLWGRYTPALVKAIAQCDRVLFHPFTSKYISFAFLPSGMVYAAPHIVFPLETYSIFGLLQSRPHEIWARFFGSSMKDDLRYTPSDCFETFPFPLDTLTPNPSPIEGEGNQSQGEGNRSQGEGNRSQKEGNRSQKEGNQSQGEGNRSQGEGNQSQGEGNQSQGEGNQSQGEGNQSQGEGNQSQKEGNRSQKEGNRSQKEEISPSPILGEGGRGVRETLEAIGKTYYEYRADLMVRNNQGLTDTYNRFHDPAESDPNILKLRQLHQEMDIAVLNAYDWSDIDTTCGFALDYLDTDEDNLPPEAQERIASGDLFFPTAEVACAFDSIARTGKRKLPWRYKWPETTHDEVLARLLDLNQKRHEEEILGGKHAQKKENAKRTQKRKSKKAQVDSPQLPLFPAKEVP